MDLGTLLGIALGFSLLLASIWAGSPLAAFFDLPSLAIVLGGTLAATLIMQKASHVLGAFRWPAMPSSTAHRRSSG
jgi:chemotaxis protein MotA